MTGATGKVGSGAVRLLAATLRAVGGGSMTAFDPTTGLGLGVQR